MKITRRGVRLLSLLVFALSCWLVAADAPGSFITIAAAMVSFLVLLGSFASPPERVGYDVPELMRHYRLTEADILRACVLDGYLFVTELTIAFVPYRQREPAWRVALKSVTWVEHDRGTVFPCITVRHEDASEKDCEKRFRIAYDEYNPDHTVGSIEAWIEHVHTRAGIPLPTLALR